MGWTKATAGGGAVAAAGRSLLGPLAAGATVHMLDSDDAIGKWMDEHIPGAAGIDRWFYEHTGGAVGRPSDAAPSAAPGQAVQLHGDVNLDGKKVGSIVANTLADQYSRSAAGTSGSDMRVSPMLPGMDGGWAP